MSRYLLIAAFICTGASGAFARGLLIPTEPDLPPLAMLNHHVDVAIENQVAVTTVQQTFRNHTDRKLEANYVFPVPQGASVKQFIMYVDGKPMQGELVRADRAEHIYTSIVRQTKNPAMLDYVGSDLLSLKIYPVPAKGDQSVQLRFTAIAKKDHEVVEYLYPLKTDRVAASTLEEFRLTVNLKSQRPLGNIYCPTHSIAVSRKNDRQAVIQYEEQGARLDRDFQLYYTHTGDDIGLTTLEHRPISKEDGYVMLLVSPRAELDQRTPRDIVFVLDTSGSMMHEKKMEQAKRALRHCLEALSPEDRFGLVNFATTVNRYRDHLTPASEESIKRAQGWVAGQYASGGTAIHGALMSALDMRSEDSDRMFTIMFITDGQPTIGETDTEKILAAVGKQNSANTRIFTLGVGENLNALFMDQIAGQTRALSRYVSPGNSFQSQVASFFNKINNPVMSNLELAVKSPEDASDSDAVRLREVYPPRLPDLFHGDQLVVLARYEGKGEVQVVLEGKAAGADREYSYELDFPVQTDDKPFVEELWARRKVGYLLDQVRINGEQQELVDEVVRLAKRYGITTPYTSYLIMPDAPVELASAGAAGRGSRSYFSTPAALAPKQQGGKQEKVAEFAKRVQSEQGQLAINRGAYQDRAFDQVANAAPADANEGVRQRVRAAQALKGSLDAARYNYANGQLRQNQVNKLGVDLAVCTNQLKCETQLRAKALCNVASRNCMEIGGVWIDEEFEAGMPTVAIKAQSDAYFRLLKRQPQLRDVFRLGNHIVWITPSGAALVLDSTDGKEQIADREIDKLFRS